jgi:hypothetical protein
MLGMTRATATLLGVAVAGFLAWLSTQVADGTTGGYWAVYGIIAGAGLALALSQLAGGWTKWGRPRISLEVFLLAFIPTLIVVGWVVLFHQPHTNWFRSHVQSWSGDIGLMSFVQTMGGVLELLTFGLGLVFGLTFDTTGPRREVAAVPAMDGRAANEPLAPDREIVGTRKRARTPITTTTVRAGSDPGVEPPPREGPPE